MTVITFSYLCKYSKSIKMSIVIERAQIPVGKITKKTV